MPSFFFDTSAIVKRYSKEAGSDFVEGLAGSESGNVIILAGITHVEVAATIARRLKGGNVTDTAAADALAAFKLDLNNRYITIDIRPDMLTAAMKIATKHALRGYDAVQLAAALDANTELLATGLPTLIVVSADGELNAAAVAEGLEVENPNDYPQMQILQINPLLDQSNITVELACTSVLSALGKTIL